MFRMSIEPIIRLLPGYVIRPVPETAVTVLCTRDDGCDGHPKHVE